MTRVVFLGTPDAAVPTLRSLAERFDVVGAITQPDRPKGRSRQPVPPPVKEAARDLGIPISQPASRSAVVDELAELSPVDLGVVVAYGRILTPQALEIPAHGMLNVHFSLLPRWRGAAPVSRALLAGDTMTGVTIIGLDEGLDTGPVLTAQAVDIRPGETAGELTNRLALLGANLLVDNVSAYTRGDLVPTPQSDDGLTYAEKIETGDRPIAIDSSPIEAANRVRALAPSPGATLLIDGEPHKIMKATAGDERVEPGEWRESSGWPLVGLRGGSLKLVEVQPPGKKPMSGDAWLRGKQTDAGSVG